METYAEALCYENDVSHKMVDDYRIAHGANNPWLYPRVVHERSNRRNGF
jgi:hypothetical protein